MKVINLNFWHNFPDHVISTPPTARKTFTQYHSSPLRQNFHQQPFPVREVQLDYHSISTLLFLTTASKRVLILRTWSLIRTFLAFWVLFGSLSQSLGVLISFGGRDTVRYRETSKIESWARIIIALGFTKTNCSEDIKCIDIDYKNTMTDTDVIWDSVRTRRSYLHWELRLPEIV